MDLLFWKSGKFSEFVNFCEFVILYRTPFVIVQYLFVL